MRHIWRGQQSWRRRSGSCRPYRRKGTRSSGRAREAIEATTSSRVLEQHLILLADPSSKMDEPLRLVAESHQEEGHIVAEPISFEEFFEAEARTLFRRLCA